MLQDHQSQMEINKCKQIMSIYLNNWYNQTVPWLMVKPAEAQFQAVADRPRLRAAVCSSLRPSPLSLPSRGARLQPALDTSLHHCICNQYIQTNVVYNQYRLLIATLFCERTITYASSSAWNTLPEYLHAVDDLGLFRKQFKTHFFSLAFDVCWRR